MSRAGLRIETRRQFVQDRDLGLANEGEDDGQPLLLPARKLAVIRTPLLVEPKNTKKVIAVCGSPVEGGVELDGLSDTNLRW